MRRPCYYFGCKEEAGHFLFTEQGSRASRTAELSLPFRYEILDAGLLPQDRNQTEGEASLIHIRGWTIVTFWDRSVDSRGNSNSSFVLPGTLLFDEAIAESMLRFPWVWSRIKFAVHLGEFTNER